MPETAGAVLTPVAPRPTFRVACVGHRSVDPDDPALAARAAEIFEALRGVLAALEASEPLRAVSDMSDGVRLVCLTSLAAGADLLLAEAARAAGARLHVALPFAADAFALDFEAHPAQLPRHRSLLAEAERRFVHDGWRGDDGSRADRALRDRAYQEAGRTLVRHCDLLVAVWNGEEAGGRGGSAEQIEAALAQGTPVLWIEAGPEHPDAADAGPDGRAAGAPVRLLESAPHLVDRPAPLAPGALADRLTTLVRSALVPPQPPGHGAAAAHDGHHHHGPWHHLVHPLAVLEPPKVGFRAQLERFYRETAVRGEGDRVQAHGWYRWLTLQDWLRNLLCSSQEEQRVRKRVAKQVGVLVKQLDSADACAAALKQTCKAAPDPDDPAVARFNRAYAVPDAVSMALARAMRSLTLLVTTFAVLAIACAAFALVLKDWKTGLAIAELVLLVIIVAMVAAANRSRMKERWLHDRLVAELLRIAAALAPFGRVMPVAPAAGEAHTGGAVPGWVTWYVNAVTRDAGLADQDLTDPDRRRALVADACARLLVGQVTYHRVNTLRVERLDRVAEAVGQYAVVATVLLILAKLGLAAFGVDPGTAGTWMTLGTVLAPTVAAGTYALRHVEEWALLARRSEAMGDALTMVARDMAGDVGNWLAVVDTKRIEVG